MSEFCLCTCCDHAESTRRDQRAEIARLGDRVVQLEAERDALAGDLRKLRWAAGRLHNGAALRLVEPAALTAWLTAHGWREDTRAEGRHARSYERVPRDGEDWLVLVPKDSAREFSDYGRAIGMALREIGRRGDFTPALVFAELLPEHGPWESDHG